MVKFTKCKKIILVLISLILITFSVAKIYQKEIVAYVTSGSFGLHDKDKLTLPKGVSWFDDYYSVQYINKNTLAIGEPRYWQQNINYLILGKNKAVLFDTGVGNEDILRVVKSITDLPLIIIPSHLHFDHIGNFDKYKNLDIRLAKIQVENEEVVNNTLTPTDDDFLGWVEGRDTPKITYSALLTDNEVLELGDRSLTVVNTTGHTSNSISLFDKENNIVFTGDFFYKGTLLASEQMPTSSLSAYQQSLSKLQAMTNENTLFYGGHTTQWRTPELTAKDLNALTSFLQGKTNNKPPKEKVINDNITISF
ncbi:hydroxyacylglutathione hydrolase [Phocoenobacter uteri]|uniref:Hydroxyacylglutathione hydrolase n=1 Tax=Phocoenobacter uteri TaxID=146806 RepID=A0A379C8V0_9PAST|nr:MBL fold metallo-hydrolase [Phocoenobacter uteri]MDG6882401.1 hypothetical protein [Phocoenobacter uteri]SUB58558.1 hydroxyacylglutathione hydrolase [Phocoenobacter uteri]